MNKWVKAFQGGLVIVGILALMSGRLVTGICLVLFGFFADRLWIHKDD